MTADATHITLDFDLRKTPIEGLLRADDGNDRPFVGYMQLVTALEAAPKSARGEAHGTTDRPAGGRA
jgi:hypothetical protein